MTLLRKLASVLCLVFLFTNFSNAQTIETTGNVVNNSNWNNAVYQQNLTCWGWGDPGYCGPLPIVRPGGNINFSYGTVDLHQIQSIASILPSSGTGLQVNGFNFGFTAKNGNGWDNGQQDYLSAYVKFYNASGGIATEYDYTSQTNQRYNWTQFNFSETFATPYAAPELSNVRYGFIGRDNNYWAGPYGPEIYNVNFSLKYSVDPCATNVYYSTSCSGYFDALAKLTPKSTTTDTVMVYTPPEAPEPPPPPPGVAPQQQAGPPPPPGAPPPPGSPPSQNSQPAQAGLAPAAASPQEKASTGTPNVGFALSLIAKNSDREKAIAQQVVAQAESQAQAAGDRATATAQATASAAVAQSTQSMDSAFTGSGIQTANSSSRVNISLATMQQQSNSAGLLNAQSFVNIAGSQQTSGPQLLAPVTVEQIQSTQNYSIFAVQEYRQQESESTTQTVNFLTDLNNPIKQILDSQQLQQQGFEQPAQAVKKDVAPNELATGVSLTQLATQPQGYASYTNFALRDASFYEPREVYKNQTVIDNIRVLRGLGSDQKHQDLVNSQYK